MLIHTLKYALNWSVVSLNDIIKQEKPVAKTTTFLPFGIQSMGFKHVVDIEMVLDNIHILQVLGVEPVTL